MFFKATSLTGPTLDFNNPEHSPQTTISKVDGGVNEGQTGRDIVTDGGGTIHMNVDGSYLYPPKPGAAYDGTFSFTVSNPAGDTVHIRHTQWLGSQ
jgi:hypothetical protein